MEPRQTHSNSVAIDKYKKGEDFASWAKRLDIAVGLAHSVGEPEQKDLRDKLCLQWLPLKIDEETFMVYEGVKGRTWDEIRAEMITLLTDPQEKYDWFANRNPIIWDGKESFHSLASRIKRGAEKNVDDNSRDKECFRRFRGALPEEYRKAIDLGCGEKWDIEEAMKIAGRLRIADADAAATATAAAGQRTVAFSGAAMSDDRIKSVEMGLQGMGVTVEGAVDEMVKTRQTLEKFLEAQASQGRSASGGRDGRDDRHRRDESRGDSRHGSRDRGRYESRDRDRRDSRDRNRDRTDSRDRGRSRYDSRDRRDRSRGRYDSRDRDRYRRYDDRSRRDSYDRNRYSDRGRDSSGYRRSSYDRDRRGDSRDRDYRRSSRYDRRSPRGYSRDSPGRNRDNRRDDYRGESRDRYGNRERNAAMDGAVAINSGNSQSVDTDSLIAALQRCLRPALPEN